MSQGEYTYVEYRGGVWSIIIDPTYICTYIGGGSTIVQVLTPRDYVTLRENLNKKGKYIWVGWVCVCGGEKIEISQETERAGLF